MRSAVTSFIARRWSVPASGLRVDVRHLQGGLESAVGHARVIEGNGDAGIPTDLVVKQLTGEFAREADVYDVLWRHLDRPPAVRMFGREVSGGTTYLYLEHATALASWPWSDTARAASVCRQLAALHDHPHLPHEPFSWNYERELLASAQQTLEFAAAARDLSGRRLWSRLGDLRRTVAALPHIRRRLLSHGATVIHGDVHPGNVILRPTDGRGPDVVLLDWARARVGSPLEDIASWLHSLGCWEPQARRRHDTLMRAYLESRRVIRRFDSEVRVDYWFASASNGLGGAIRYHLAVLADPASTLEAQANSRTALAAWVRVVRRAAALLSTTRDHRTRAPRAGRPAPRAPRLR